MLVLQPTVMPQRTTNLGVLKRNAPIFTFMTIPVGEVVPGIGASTLGTGDLALGGLTLGVLIARSIDGIVRLALAHRGDGDFTVLSMDHFMIRS